jgi:hypothetical protein
MEGDPEPATWPWLRAQQYQRDHPGTVICLVEGWWHAWVPKQGGDRSEGTEVEPQRHLADLLERLGELAA